MKARKLDYAELMFILLFRVTFIIKLDIEIALDHYADVAVSHLS